MKLFCVHITEGVNQNNCPLDDSIKNLRKYPTIKQTHVHTMDVF